MKREIKAKPISTLPVYVAQSTSPAQAAAPSVPVIPKYPPYVTIYGTLSSGQQEHLQRMIELRNRGVFAVGGNTSTINGVKNGFEVKP